MGRLIVVGTVRRAVAGLCLENERGRSSKPDPDRRDLLQLASKQLSQRRAVGWIAPGVALRMIGVDPRAA
eukprot:scaffold21153_cov116-Isochrysis_galbana.AAC.3